MEGGISNIVFYPCWLHASDIHFKVEFWGQGRKAFFHHHHHHHQGTAFPLLPSHLVAKNHMLKRALA